MLTFLLCDATKMPPVNVIHTHCHGMGPHFDVDIPTYMGIVGGMSELHMLYMITNPYRRVMLLTCARDHANRYCTDSTRDM